MKDTPAPLATGRVAAIDVFRALTMYFMLFVNDIPGLRDIPHRLLHAAYDEDMMGFSDTIFPAFIFCMGASVVLAIEHRYRKGDTTLQVIAHVAVRTVALVVMGLFTLNCTGFDAGLSYPAFSALMVVGFFLVWGVYPVATGVRRGVYTAMKWTGVLLLAGLVLYCDMHGKPFSVGWWGILGLIGWTYAVCAVIYLFVRSRIAVMGAVWAVVVLIAVLAHSDLIPTDYAVRVVTLPFVPSDWTLHALGVSGMLATLLMLRLPRRRFYAVMLGSAVAFTALGWLCHQYWIVSKIQATPTWLFWCLAMFLPLLTVLHQLCDVRGKAAWFGVIKPAGTATLTCYIIPYLWYAAMMAMHLSWPDALCAGWPGLLRSLLYSLAVVWLAALLVRFGIKLKV